VSTPLLTICAFCGHEHDLASAVTEPGVRQEPRPCDGDATMCIRCGQINIVDQREAGGLRQPSQEEATVLAKDQMVQHLVQAWRDTIGRGKVQ